MRRWLLAAGVYNLLWGAAVVLAPDAPLRLFGVEPLAGTGRAVWQCLGMVIGVYGIGYLAASLDPLRHWPIVLVGFLGKVFGPIGFVWCASRGEIDWKFGITIPTNDLLWWIPFALILRAAWLKAQTGEACAACHAGAPSAPRTVGSVLNLAHDQHGRSLAQLSGDGRILLVAVRHFGCTFCRETLADIRAHRADLAARGVRIAILHPATAAEAAPALARAGLADIPAIADPSGAVAAALGIERGSFTALLGPRNVLRAVPAFLAGHGIGYPVGDPLRMPAVFVLERGRVVTHHHHRFAGERVDFRALAAAGSPNQSPALAPDASPAHT
jgi:hypothetical protein